MGFVLFIQKTPGCETLPIRYLVLPCFYPLITLSDPSHTLSDPISYPKTTYSLPIKKTTRKLQENTKKFPKIAPSQFTPSYRTPLLRLRFLSNNGSLTRPLATTIALLMSASPAGRTH